MILDENAPNYFHKAAALTTELFNFGNTNFAVAEDLDMIEAIV